MNNILTKVLPKVPFMRPLMGLHDRIIAYKHGDLCCSAMHQFDFELHDDLVDALLDRLSKSTVDDRNALKSYSGDADHN